MRDTPLHQLYSAFTPEERFRLIYAAGSRDDSTEQSRLRQSGGTVTRSFAAHVPSAHAFLELSQTYFLFLLEESLLYRDLMLLKDDPQVKISLTPPPKKEPQPPSLPGEEPVNAEVDLDRIERELNNEMEPLNRLLALGYRLHAQARGWELFCRRRAIPPFTLWETMPGYSRLQLGLKLAENVAFKESGYRRWLNEKRPAGAPKLKVAPLTAKRVAREIQTLYQRFLEWWGSSASPLAS